jgi:translocation and assembly module TamB
MSTRVHGWRRVWRWTKRGLLGLGALMVVASAALVILVHTRFGRELARKQVVAKLDTLFVGGTRIGTIEGSPFGELVLRDVVLNGPDGKPAVFAKKVTLGIGLLALISKHANLESVVAEDVEVRLARDQDGKLEAAYMIRPTPPTGWSIDIPDLKVRRAHIAYDTGTEWMNVDAVEMFGAVHMPDAQPMKANFSVRGAWRERVVGVGVDAVVTIEHNTTTVASLIAHAGAVTIAGANLRIITPLPPEPLTAGKATAPMAPSPIISGTLIVNAPAVGVALLAPQVKPPANIAVALNISAAAPWTHLSLIGQLGATPVRGMLDVDLGTRIVKGVISSGELDLAVVSTDRLRGTAGGVVMFEAKAGATGALPTARGVIAMWGQVLDLPDARATIAFDTNGQHLKTVIGAASDSLHAMIEGEVTRAGTALTLDRGTIIASTQDPAAASRGKAPVHGALSVRLAAHGALSPETNLAVSGRIDGRQLRMKDVSVATLSLAIDARQIPCAPTGKVKLAMTGIVRQGMQLGKLEVTAGSRPDGKIQVSARSRPAQDPWLIDLDALVTLPGRSEITTIDLQRHHVRAGNGGDWNGSTGHVEVGPRRLELRGFATSGPGGAVAVAGSYDRSTGDFVAKIDGTMLALSTFDPRFLGTVDAHVDVTRTRGRFAGTADVTGTKLALGTSLQALDLAVKLHATAGQLLVDATASSPTLGAAKVTLDVDAPKDLTDLAAWRQLHRDAIRSGHLALQKVDLAKVADLAGRSGDAAGRLDGELQLTSTSLSGAMFVRDLRTPSLRGSGPINVDVQVSQSAGEELLATLTGHVAPFGRVQIAVRGIMPDHVFDPAVWTAFGPHAVRAATLRVDQFELDPAQLERFGITTEMRGRISLSVEVGESLESAKVIIDVAQLRGSPIVKPVDVHGVAEIDASGATTTLSIRSGTLTLLDVHGKARLTLEQLLADPGSVMSTPLALTATIPSAPAPALFAVFGRTEVIGGTLEGSIVVAGTLGKPTFIAKLVGTKLQVPPGPRNKPVKMIDTITLDGSWDGSIAKLAIDGVEQGGKLHVLAEGNLHALAQGSMTIQATAFDLVPVLAFAPGPAGGAAGRLDANLSVKGLDPATMRIAGELHLTGARVPVAPQVGTLRRAKLDVVINDRELKIDVTGKLGAGDLTLASTFVIDGAMPVTGDATLTLRKVSPIGAVEPVVDADITAKLHRNGGQWIADVTVKNGNIVVPSGRGEALKPVGAPTDMVFAGDDRMSRRPMLKQVPVFASIVANITIYSTSVKSDELRGLIKGKVTISADAESVGIVGSIEADRGDLDLFGRRYEVDRAAVHFDGSTDPLLDLRISHEFADVSTVTEVHGRLSKPELVLSSNPGIYTQGQLLGFLLGGEPSGDPSGGSASDQATSVGSSFVANKLGGYVKSALPIDIDVLRYEAATASTGSAVTVGTWVTRTLFVAYRQHLESRVDENLSEGAVEYWLSRRISIEATAGDRGYDGIDLLWRRRY